MSHRNIVTVAASLGPACLVAFIADLPLLMALVCALIPAVLIAMAFRDGTVRGATAWVLVAFVVLLLANLLGILHYAGAEVLWGPAPPGLVLLLIGIGLLPLPLLCAAYAFGFTRTGISEEDLRSVRLKAATRSANKTEASRERRREQRETGDSGMTQRKTDPKS